MNKKEILTHYEFQKYIALALIDEQRWGPHSEKWRKVLTKKGKGVAYSNEYQPMEKANKDKIQATRINEQTLDPITGKLRNRLCYGGQHNLRLILSNTYNVNLYVLCIGLPLEEKILAGSLERSVCGVMTVMSYYVFRALRNSISLKIQSN